ncbi:alpha/beta hydrolase family protein [Janthinobacterium violaceinigrum]|uniref:Prolyl oligopeptidase family serine peptidase n=1 Tax=Janthinobacterium violaceinigrum TaxID=2654252 RepID=A0A6I1HZX3_9BURK|nr:alpha/beta fold hydrolase [Janthinobacterium violaceinigrum]KAB8062809.1 prolyl oligopeptidase family serine peptidase [Janthinobacterium violaceinigrum]
MTLLHFLRAALAAVFLVATNAGAQAAPPVSAFFSNPEFSGALLSPDARHLAVKVNGPNKRERLAVVNLLDNSIKVVAQFSDVDVGDVEWVNDERLILNTRDLQTAPGDLRYGPGLFAVNRDGSDFRLLAARSAELIRSTSIYKLLPWHTYLTGQRGAQHSSAVYVRSTVYTPTGEADYESLRLLDTLTGRSTSVKPPGKVRRWLLDQNGEPRLAVTRERNIESVQYLDPDSGGWRQLAQFDAYLGGPDAFTPLSFGPDGTLYVSARMGNDTLSVHAYDLAGNRIVPTPFVSLDGYDFSGNLIVRQGKLLGVRHLSDALATRWFDPAMAATQARIDALLPNTINLVSLAARPATPFMLVTSYSDRQPGKFTLFNSDTGKLSIIGETQPLIQPGQMSEQQLVRYKVRDGLDIPAWLTVPNGGSGKPLPLVVLVHGGPYLRGSSWQWDAQVQFLASRGYAVLQPEFRGSTGFGSRHFRAGWKQWGLKMQDDIADGARWAIGQGIADPRRICIAGASYGGYAALMGLVNDPDLFRCAIDWVGVTDINLLYSGHWSFKSDLGDDWKQYGMPELIGDRTANAAQFQATSPIAQAARITQPLLLAYGAADRRVPLYHGKQFYAAVKQHNRDVEWVVYEEEGHGWTLPQNRIDFWGRVEKFLDRNIGKDSTPAKKE